MGQRFDLAVVVTATGATITTAAGSASVNIPFASSGEVPRYIRIASTSAACVRMGPIAGATATLADTQIQPGDALIMAVPLGYTKIAAIMVSAAGSLQISPLENM